MLQVAVCDDEAVFLDRTVQILHDAFGEMPHAIQTFQTAGAALSAIGETDYRPDIAVLDIRLADADGIALAKQINRSVPACRIIFLSSYTGYLMDAYEAEHVYYVLKPDMAARLPVALRKALTALASDKALTVRRGASVQRIALDRVLCLERFLHRTVIHMTDGDLETTQDPRELLESGQAEDHFIHCHKSFWVNEQMIASMERDNFRLNGGMLIPISRSHRDAARAAFLWRVLDGPRFSTWLTAVLAAAIGAVYMAATLLLTNAGQVRTLMFPLCSLAMAFLLFRGRAGRKMLAVATELAVSLLMELMFTPLMIDLQPSDKLSVWADPRALIYGVTFLPVLALGLGLLSLLFTRSKNNLSGKQLLIFSAFPITQMFCEASLVTLMFSPPHFEYIPMQLIVSVLFLVSDILLYRTMVHTEQCVQLEVENQLLEKQLDAQLAHYSDLTGQYEQIRTMRHDISHHLNTINALLQAGNLKAASEYSEQLLPMQTYISRLGKCKNPVVDAFLYSRMQDAEAKGVPVQADVSLPVELPVSNTDLIVAFGNMLDNALEACEGVPGTQIRLQAYLAKGYLVIHERNPVRGEPAAAKPRRIPELERGVGFRVLSGLAQKYDGSFRHELEPGGDYAVTLMLKAAPDPVVNPEKIAERS